MRLSWTAFTELLRCTLLGHLRNRLALVLAIAFIPIWIAVARLCTSGQVVHIRLDAISTPVSAPASQAGHVASALGAITMVAGFIAFTETFQSREMDRRLLLAGYPRLPILLAKLAAVASPPPCWPSTPRSCCGSPCPYATQHPWRWPLRAPALPTAASVFCSALWSAASWRASSSSSCSAWSTPACRIPSSTRSWMWRACPRFLCTACTSWR
ncbi:hypothetical protein [Streptomyces mirabilis]|uniref:hypothetical protein n=1 Tax=Streptomyces mirabilis TaxID=68239 RepID=UPI002E299D5E|nr:hypothetical protein [Streptomyces mirabilis]